MGDGDSSSNNTIYKETISTTPELKVNQIPNIEWCGNVELRVKRNKILITHDSYAFV